MRETEASTGAGVNHVIAGAAKVGSRLLLVLTGAVVALALLPYDGHFDSSGHEAIAEQLYQGVTSFLRAEADHGA